MADRCGADYAKVGFAVVAGIAAIVVSLAYFGGVGGKRGEFLAETWYDAAVSGLSVGSEVNYRGVKVGEVKSISFIGGDYAEASERDRQKVRVVLAFNSRLVRARPGSTPLGTIRHLVKKGVRATVASSGITGLSRIELDFPMVPPPDERISWTPEHVAIPPAPSILESFADSATRVMHHLNGMDLAQTCSNVTDIVASAASVAGGLDALVDANRPVVAEILSNLEAASRSLREFADELRDEPSLLLRSRREEPLPETARQ